MENMEGGVDAAAEKEGVTPEEQAYLAMPTGVDYEKSDWAAEIESKEAAVRDAYLEVMDWINAAARVEVNKYMQSHPEESLEWSDKEKEDFFSLGGVEVIDTETKGKVEQALRLRFSVDESYLLTRYGNEYHASLENFGGRLIPEELMRSIRSQLQDYCSRIADRFNRI